MAINKSAAATSLDDFLGEKSSNNNGAKQRKQAQFWLNVGMISYDDDGKEIFIGMERGGFPLDDLEPRKVTNPESSYGKMQLAKNKLLTLVQKAAADLQPGEAEVVKGEGLLRIEIRRSHVAVTEVDDEAAETNQHLARISSEMLI